MHNKIVAYIKCSGPSRDIVGAQLMVKYCIPQKSSWNYLFGSFDNLELRSFIIIIVILIVFSILFWINYSCNHKELNLSDLNREYVFLMNCPVILKSGSFLMYF